MADGAIEPLGAFAVLHQADHLIGDVGFLREVQAREVMPDAQIVEHRGEHIAERVDDVERSMGNGRQCFHEEPGLGRRGIAHFLSQLG